MVSGYSLGLLPYKCLKVEGMNDPKYPKNKTKILIIIHFFSVDILIISKNMENITWPEMKIILSMIFHLL